MKIDHISISREGVWKTCKQQYKYKYHEQVPSGQPTPFYFTFGKIVHRAIEEYTKARGLRDIKEITDGIMNGTIHLEPGHAAPPLTPEYQQKLNKHISHFLGLSKKIGLEGEVEWPFYFDLDPPNKRTIKGFIDRIITNQHGMFLIDYKTTKPSPWRKDHRTITKDLQLQCYCWVAWQHFKVDPTKIKAALYYLEDDKLVPVTFCEQTLLTVPQRLLDVYLQIERANPDQVHGTVGDHCRRCDWRAQCPFYRLI